jgi:hypothetical protein
VAKRKPVILHLFRSPRGMYSERLSIVSRIDARILLSCELAEDEVGASLCSGI